MTLIPATQGYNRRPAPPDYTKGWMDVEFGNLQRGIWKPTSRTVVANYTAQSIDNVLFCNATTAPFTVTLPLPAQAKDLLLTIKKVDASGHAVTIGGTVDGTANPTLAAQYNAMTVQSDGSAWYILSSM